ncbi:hypothetical protein CRYUN_Cryun23aG0068800 [Craigia yunnanensis]
MELGKQLPPPIVLPERRLEHLVETSVTAQIDSCMHHNSQEDVVSLYEDHCCGRDQMATETILTDHSNEVWFVQFSNNGEYLDSSSSDCTAIIWKVMDNDKLTMKHMLRSHQNPVSFVAWSPDDTKLLTCGNLEVLRLWDAETATCKHTFGNYGFTVSSCAWFPDSKRIVCGSSDPDKGICMWDCDGNEMKAWRGMRMPKVLDLAVTSDGENLISIFSDKEIWILNLRTNAEKGHNQNKYVIRSCFGGFNSMFISSGSENTQPDGNQLSPIASPLCLSFYTSMLIHVWVQHLSFVRALVMAYTTCGIDHPSALRIDQSCFLYISGPDSRSHSSVDEVKGRK